MADEEPTVRGEPFVLVADERGDPPGRWPEELMKPLPPGAKVAQTEFVSPDPWAHRATGMRCRTCMWFVVKATGDARGALGRCRRHAPTMSGYPATFESDWCGDHKLDETKL